MTTEHKLAYWFKNNANINIVTTIKIVNKNVRAHEQSIKLNLLAY